MADSNDSSRILEVCDMLDCKKGEVDRKDAVCFKLWEDWISPDRKDASCFKLSETVISSNHWHQIVKLCDFSLVW